MLLHFPLPHFQRPQEDKSQRAFHSAQQPTACEEAAAGEMFNAEHYRKTNSDRIVVSDNLLTSCGALMRSQRAGDCVGGGSAQPASRHSRTSTARLRVTSISPSSSSIIATCAYYIIIRSSPGSVLSFAVVDKTHLLCNKCNKCNKKIVGYYN